MYRYHILHNVTYNENVADTKTSRHQLSYGGRPNISGLNSVRESSTRVARCWCVCVLIPLWGVQTHCIPAAWAASTPLGASSNTKTCNLNTNNFLTSQEKKTGGFDGFVKKIPLPLIIFLSTCIRFSQSYKKKYGYTYSQPEKNVLFTKQHLDAHNIIKIRSFI